MRSFLVAVAVCGCSGAGEVAQEQTDAPLVVPGGALCFRVDSPELREVYDFDVAATKAASEWGRDLILDPRCESVFALDDLSVAGNDRHRAAVHRPWRSPDGVVAPVGRGGLSMILFDREAVLSGGIVDLDASTCDAQWVAGEQPKPLLSRVLTHELGHALGLPDSDSQSGAMFWFGGVCLHIEPSDAERSAANTSSKDNPVQNTIGR